jgi:uncharacterized protein YigA (DUF484 family)
MSTRQQGIPQDVPEEPAIADYLRNHPEFFVTHAELLAEIRVPHHPEGTVSLIERQVSVLRERNLELKRQLHALVQVARDNDRLNEQMQKLTLALLDAPDLSATLRVLSDSLHDDFNAEALVMGLFIAESQLPRWDEDGLLTLRALSAEDEGAAGFAAVHASGKPLCGHLRRAQVHYLFGPAEEENIASAVVLALNAPDGNTLQSRQLGILGIGSRDPRRYHAGMGTLFLTYLGVLIGRAVGRYLPLR